MTDHPVDRLAPVLDRADQLYVGVGTSTGPHVTPELFACTGGRIVCSPACVTFDAWTGFGPSGKQGLMLRGQGQVRDTGRVAIDVDRVSYWDGVVTGSTRGSS